jgi:MFS family permease
MIQSYIDSPEKQQKLFRRTLLIVVISQIFGGAGLAAGITVGALLAQDMLGTDSFAGVPVALFTLGSAGAALLIGRLSQRFGRRFGLAIGFLAGILVQSDSDSSINQQYLPALVSLLIYGWHY